MLQRLPTSRTILLTCLLVVGGVCLYSGVQRFFPSADVEPADDGTTESPLPESDEPVKPAESLALHVKVHDRFPLLKKVQQILKQPSPHGGWTTNQSTLELLLSVSVEEIRPPKKDDANAGVIRMSVRYHRIRFSQDLPGHEIEYDSDRPPVAIPLAVQAYHGLKDNGFQFWLGQSNQIVETVGFDKFLERCLQGVRPQHRDRVRSIVEGTSGTEGVANFIDQSIGILPNDAVREGAVWTTEKKYLQPVPMWLKQSYTLKKLQPERAEIEILGSVEKIANFLDRTKLGTAVHEFENPQHPSRSVAVEIHSGHTVGSCVIDRKTGLPRDARVEQTLAMTVHMPGGVEFPQEKTTVTTIGYFTHPEAAPITIGGAPRDDSRIQQAHATQDAAQK